MSDPREVFWQKLGIKRAENPEHRSEAPEAGLVEPDVPGPGRALPLFAPQTPLDAPPEHPGHLPPHYPMLDTKGEQYAPEVSARRPRPVAVPGMPGGNEFYDRFGSKRLTWRQSVEAEAHGSVTPPAAGTSSSFSLSVFTPSPLGLRVAQQPSTGRAYVVLRRVTLCPRTVADTGGIQWVYVDRGGQSYPLANTPANSGLTLDMALLTAFPLVEPNPPDLGSLQITSSAGSVIAAVWDYAFAFSFAYVRSGELAKGDWP